MYTYLTDDNKIRAVIDELNRTSVDVVVDIETTGLDPWKDEIIDVQFEAPDGGGVIIIPGDRASHLRSLTVGPIGANLKFDIGFLYRKGVDVRHWRYRDVQLMGHLLDENRESQSLDSYVQEWFHDNYKEAFWSKYKTYQEAPKEEAWAYGAKDIIRTRNVHDRMVRGLRDQAVPDALIAHVHELQYELLRTELGGVRVDLEYLTALGSRLKERTLDLRPRLRSAAPIEIETVEMELWAKELAKFKTDKKKATIPRPEFSFSSSPQLKSLLYNHLGLPVQLNEKTKAVSTDYDSLQRIRDKHPVIELIQEYRELEKVYTAYIDGTLLRVRGDRIFPEFRVNGTHTSRISHQNPNLGQLPKSGGVKGIYVPDDGEVFSDLDYGQLEVCIEAHFTRDPNLLEIVLKGASKHDITAASLKISRDLAKTVNFASQYFCGPKKLAQILSCSMEEAQYQYNKYWETYAGVKAFKALVDKREEQGHVTDLFGRRRRFPTKPTWEGDKAYRQGYNFVIQSTGGQLMNNAFYKASRWIRENNRGRGGMWTVHDSGLFSHKPEYAEEDAVRVKDIMINEGVLVGLTVPLTVDYVTGCLRWQD